MANYKRKQGKLGKGFQESIKQRGKNAFTVSVYIHLSSSVVSATQSPSGLKAKRQPPPTTLLDFHSKVVSSFEMFSFRDPIHNFDATDLPNSQFEQLYPKHFRGGLKVDLVSPVWPPALSKVSLSENLFMILGVFSCFFFDKISFPGQTVHFAIAFHTYSESYCSSP